MSENKHQQLRKSIIGAEFNGPRTAGDLLCAARRALMLSRESIAYQMGIKKEIWEKYENNRKIIPVSILIKIFMFGLVFWTRKE